VLKVKRDLITEAVRQTHKNEISPQRNMESSKPSIKELFSFINNSSDKNIISTTYQDEQNQSLEAQNVKHYLDELKT
jgi:hypothetical protein